MVKLLPETCTKNLTVSCTKTTRRPITLHGLCDVLHSFCDGMSRVLFRIRNWYQKNWYQIDRHTCKFLVPDDWYQLLVRVSPALVLNVFKTCVILWSQWFVILTSIINMYLLFNL